MNTKNEDGQTKPNQQRQQQFFPYLLLAPLAADTAATPDHAPILALSSSESPHRSAAAQASRNSSKTDPTTGASTSLPNPSNAPPPWVVGLLVTTHTRFGEFSATAAAAAAAAVVVGSICDRRCRDRGPVVRTIQTAPDRERLFVVVAEA